MCSGHKVYKGSKKAAGLYNLDKSLSICEIYFLSPFVNKVFFITSDNIKWIFLDVLCYSLPLIKIPEWTVSLFSDQQSWDWFGMIVKGPVLVFMF